MGTRTVNHCDVFPKTTKDVNKYRIQVDRLQKDAQGNDAWAPVALCPADGIIKELGIAGYKRLWTFLNRGTSPPRKRVSYKEPPE